jgi:DNA-binding ferritin-like protein
MPIDPREKQAYMEASPAQREVVRRLLGNVLGLLRAQRLSYQTSHWQTCGVPYYGNHLLFQRLYESVDEEFDTLAEKMVGYLGIHAVDLKPQLLVIATYGAQWDAIDCHHRRGLQSEKDCQAAIKAAYEGIKAANAMTLGLDDYLMATANSHETNSYLLQQVLQTPPMKQAKLVEKWARKAGKTFFVSPKEKARADRSVPGSPFTIISRPQKDGSYMVAAVNPDTGELVFEGAVEYADGKEGVGDAIRRLNRHLDKNTGLSTRMTNRSRHQHKASGAPSAESDFRPNPRKEEVEQFADSGAISNDPEIAAEAAAPDKLNLSEAQEVADAKKAPPTPTEIDEMPGADAVSTLNRYVVESEDPDAQDALSFNRQRMASWLAEIEGKTK